MGKISLPALGRFQVLRAKLRFSPDFLCCFHSPTLLHLSSLLNSLTGVQLAQHLSHWIDRLAFSLQETLKVKGMPQIPSAWKENLETDGCSALLLLPQPPAECVYDGDGEIGHVYVCLSIMSSLALCSSLPSLRFAPL